MQTVSKVTGVLTDKGLDLKVEEIKVVSEKEKALVLDTDDFQTLFKSEKKAKFKDYLDHSRIIEYTTKGNLEVVGYYEDKAMAKEMAKKAVRMHLLDKATYLQGLAEKLG